jgi:hypothetical protein
VAELLSVPRGVRLGELPELLAVLPGLVPGDSERYDRDLSEMRREAVVVC